MTPFCQTMLITRHQKLHAVTMCSVGLTIWNKIKEDIHVSLPPAMKLRQGNVFTPVCQSFCSHGVCVPACTTGYMTGGSLSEGVSVWAGLSPVGSLPGGLLSGGVSVHGGSLSRGSVI